MKEKEISDIYEQLSGEESKLEQLLGKIPGLSGYMEKGKRRDADQILRDTISKQLNEVRLQLSNVHHEISQDIGLAMKYAEKLGRADNRLMGLIATIKEAPQGYAGFFDAKKIKEDDLARIYVFDEHMLGFVDKIAEDVQALEGAAAQGANIDSSIRQLNDDLALASETFNQRNEVLLGIS